ncbi:MAG: hypothetical protein U0R80_10045 [Nocardioidaceae bacterium]
MTLTRLHAVLVGAPLVLGSLVACSDGPPVAVDSTPTLSASPTGSPTPHWPAQGCDEHSVADIDYVPEASGPPTRAEAIMAKAPSETGYHLVRVPREPHRNPAWWVVDDDSGEIVLQASAWKGQNGWLVDAIERCA